MIGIDGLKQAPHPLSQRGSVRWKIEDDRHAYPEELCDVTADCFPEPSRGANVILYRVDLTRIEASEPMVFAKQDGIRLCRERLCQGRFARSYLAAQHVQCRGNGTHEGSSLAGALTASCISTFSYGAHGHALPRGRSRQA